MRTGFMASACVMACYALGAQAAPPHSITYAKKAEEPGKVITIAGRQFVIVRLPVRAFTGEKYSITFPAPRDEADQFAFAILPTQHLGDGTGFTQNMTIDGYPAQVDVADGRTYQLTPDFFSPETNQFSVSAQVSASVLINLGGTLLVMGESFDTKDPIGGGPLETDVNIGGSYNAAGSAEWWKYTEPQTQVNALDYWIDYIRIYKY